MVCPLLLIDKRSGLPFSQGGHFADSNLVQFPLNGQVTVYDNGVINATTEIRGSDGLFYLKSNSKKLHVNAHPCGMVTYK